MPRKRLKPIIHLATGRVYEDAKLKSTITACGLDVSVATSGKFTATQDYAATTCANCLRRRGPK